MTNILKKSILIVAACWMAAFAHAQSSTPIANLDFAITSSTTTVPQNYVYSSSNTPSIKVQNGITCIIISDGGGSTAPTFNGSAAPSGGKRWMAFCPDVDCSVVIGIMSNKKKFFIQDANGEFYSHTNTANAVEEETVTGLKAGKWYAMCGASSQVYVTKMTFIAAAPAGPVAVTGVTLNKSSLTIEAGQNETLVATVAPTNADNQNVTWKSSNTAVATVSATGEVSALTAGTATITVTTEDGNKTATCTVTVTAPAAPIPVTAIALNKTTTTIYVGATETLTVSYTPTDANTGKAITWTSSNTAVATVNNGVVTAVTTGQAVITATSEGNYTATCTVNVDVAHPTGVSLNKSTISLQIGGNETLTATVAPSNASDKSVTWESSNTGVATVDANGKVVGIAAGEATITVKTVDGNKTTTCTVTVTAGPPVPSTTLSIHEPEIYEAKDIAGGYNTPLVVVNKKEYEVYYINRDNSGSNVTIATSNADKAGNICSEVTTTNAQSKDGWIQLKSNGTGGDQNAAATAEYQTSLRSCKLTNTSHVLEMHIKGYDEFSFYGRDNNGDASKNKMFEVYIDDVKQTRTPSTDYKIERFSITTGEHVIRITGSAGAGDNKLCSFSLRIAQEPRTKYLKGNDSTQNVLQTTSPKPVYYYTKYNSQGETRLVWNGAEATGITLNIQGHGEVGDTLVLSGTAQCPVGTYHYNVISYFNGLPTRSVAGKLQVSSDLKAQNDTIIDAYQGEEMDEIIFRYYALSANDVHLQWTGATPAGITGSGNNGKFIISGTPTQTGTYTYIISVDGSQPITGKIEVKPLDLGNNPILFLYKNNLSYEHNDVFKYLTGKGKNLIARKAKNELRPMDQYNKYKWILISEDVDADNEEVLDVIRGASGLPVLNLKGFTYSEGRLGWGNPDNGSVDTTTNNGTKIFVQREDHPIFASFSGKKQGDAIQIFKAGSGQGVMPINVSKQKSLCLATGYTRDIDHYMSDGELQTAIHEVPASQRGGSKYICLPISGKAELTTDGQKLLDAIVTYLTTNTESPVSLPELQINSFSIFGVAGKIDQNANTIEMAFNVLDYPNINLRAIVPTIKLADPKYTFVTPASGDTVNFQYSTFMPIEFVVSDYINKRVYNVTVTMYNPQGIDEVYTVGEWVNIFDVYGRKIATTNENIYTMDLPRGMYIVVTESGETIKIMR